MSMLVVGLSYRTAPLALLERATLPAQACRRLEAALCRSDHVAEAVVLSTCNRLEIYVEVSKFHGGVADVGARLAAATGVALHELTDHLYVHYEAAAVAHLFTVVCGLDSMAVGEQQILGQVRLAMRAAAETGSVGRSLSAALQQALRLGKRAHTETGLDRAGRSLVEAGLDHARTVLGPLTGATVLVVGAGAMSGLAVATLARAGVGDLLVVNRTVERAARLAAGAGGRAVPLAGLPGALAEADLVVSCTGAVGFVVDAAAAGRAHAARGGRPQVYVDLALPRDVAPAVADLDGVSVLDLEALGRRLVTDQVSADLAEVRDLVAEEVAAFLAAQRAEAVAPTVVALRALARSVVESELARLTGRLGEIDERVRAELEQTVHRVVEKLLHYPTVRVKELAGEPGGDTYAEALRELFGLDLEAVSAVSSVRAGSELSVGEITVSAVGPGGCGMILRLGTRRSPLATAQSRWVADRIEKAAAAAGTPATVELVELTTHGDVSGAPLSSFGGVGVFVSRLREALLSGEVDVAVHSLKDLPTAPATGLLLAAIPLREDPRDVLVARDGLTLGELPTGARIGTGSPRRAAQLRALGLGLEVVDIRGNVDTRIRFVHEGTLDAVVLARAGLLRLGRAGEATEVLDPLVMLPAPGQGALAVECRDAVADEPLAGILARLDDASTRAAVSAERALLAALEAGCAAPLGALAEVVEGEDGEELSLRTVVASLDGAVTVRRSTTGPVDAADRLGKELAAQLLEEGVAELIPQRPPPRPAPTAAAFAAVAVAAESLREGDL